MKNVKQLLSHGNSKTLKKRRQRQRRLIEAGPPLTKKEIELERLRAKPGPVVIKAELPPRRVPPKPAKTPPAPQRAAKPSWAGQVAEAFRSWRPGQ